MRFVVSQWNTANNDPYHCVLFEDTLQAAGPLVEAQPKPKPPVVKPVEPPTFVDTTPEVPVNTQELYELLLRELSASGSTKITTPEGDNVTLRVAIEQIFWKERGPHKLSPGRPRHPDLEDDQLGHVLNARAEGLFTQAVVVAIADTLKIDVAELYSKVQEAL